MSKTILVIDDNADLLQILQEALGYEGFEAITRPDADGYDKVIRENGVDLVIIDYLLPGVNGGEICHQIKCSREFKHIPVILFSAYPRVLLSLGTYGCDAFVAKPFDLGEIIDQITLLLHCTSNHLFVY